MSRNRRLFGTLTLITFLQLTEQHCYLMKPLNFSLWDTPNYGLVMKMYDKNNSMASVTTVRKDVPIPMWHLVLMQHPNRRRATARTEKPRVLYNASMKTCEFWKYMRRVTAWNNFAKQVLSGGGSNMSLACPLRAGIYVMNVIQVPPDTALLKFMYQPNTLYTVQGTVYSLSPKDGVTRHAICHYEVNATIFKTC